MEESFVDIQNGCRICLRSEMNMFPLDCLLNAEGIEGPTIKKTIQDTFAIKTNPFANYPENVCNDCLVQVINAHQLKQQILQTEKILSNSQSKKSDLTEEGSTVEILVGDNKFNLNDLIIVENEENDNNIYSGFLKNLGKTVSASFVDKNTPKKHIKEEKPIVMVIKEDCNSVNIKSNVELVLADLDQKQDIVKSELKPQLSCSMCHQNFSNHWYYYKHLGACQKVKTGAENSTHDFICPICKKRLRSKFHLMNHVRSKHISQNEPRFSCEACKATFNSRPKFVYHKQVKHLVDRFVCQYCGKKFASNTSLKTHILIHTHGDKPQCICPICGKTFNYKGGLFYHLKMHNRDCKYLCPYCDKKYYTATAHKRHIRTHTHERPYGCKYCGKKFCSNGELKRHVYLHTGSMPYHCQYCKKGFATKYNLNRHIISHPGKYQCEICDKAFVNPDVLKTHYDTHKESQ